MKGTAQGDSAESSATVLEGRAVPPRAGSREPSLGSGWAETLPSISSECAEFQKALCGGQGEGWKDHGRWSRLGNALRLCHHGPWLGRSPLRTDCPAPSPVPVGQLLHPAWLATPQQPASAREWSGRDGAGVPVGVASRGHFPRPGLQGWACSWSLILWPGRAPWHPGNTGWG